MGSSALGIVLAALSALFNGSFAALSKFEPVKEAGVSSVHFNFWVAAGLTISSLPLLAIHQEFTLWGGLSGAFFVASTGCTFSAIQKLGISVASALWCGVAMLASFIWGLRVNGDQLQNKGFTIPALLLLVGGLAGIAVNGRYSETIREQREEADEEESARLHQRRLSEERIMDPFQQHESVPKGPEQYGIGCVAAVGAGLFGGLILAPKSFASGVHGLAYLPSMGIGVVVAAPVLTLLIASINRDYALPSKQSMKVGATYGICAGILWNLGNILSILATERVGVAVAYPIFQCGLFVAGLWGIVLFEEVERRCIPAYLLSGIALVVGAACLALAK